MEDKEKGRRKYGKNVLRRKILSPQSRRKTEKEKDENFWSAEGKKKGERKGGKYSEKEKMTDK